MKWMKRIKCLLSGGHRYANVNLLMMKDPFKPEYIFTNNCLKCGNITYIRVPKSSFDSILEADLRRKREEDGK